MSHTFDGADAIRTSIQQAVCAFQCRGIRCIEQAGSARGIAFDTARG
jgi:hypothetical protein